VKIRGGTELMKNMRHQTRQLPNERSKEEWINNKPPHRSSRAESCPLKDILKRG